MFFPKLPPTQALVFSYLAFGAGFPARVLGAFIFGHFGDRVGRKASFLINILIVGGATCLTGLLPGYATLGIAASIIVVFLRIVQGIGLGGEFGGASSLLAEFGTKRRSWAFWMSLASFGAPLGTGVAAAALLLFSKTFATTGWRIAMLLSAIILIPALVARYKLADSPLFERLKQREQLATMPSFKVFKKHAWPTILISLVLSFTAMDGYVSSTYAISFMKFAGIPLATTATIILSSRIADALGIVVSGPLSDLLKRRVVAYIAIGVTTLLSYPWVMAILGKRILLVLVLQFLISLFGMGLLKGLAPILTSESLPTKFRYSGNGISYSVGFLLGGMFAPSLLAGLIGQDVLQKWYYLPHGLRRLLCCGYAGATLLSETRDLRMEDLDAEGSRPAASAEAARAKCISVPQ